MAKDYNISRPGGQCTRCSRALEPQQEIVAVVREGDEGLERQDFCIECHVADPADRAPDVLASWRTSVPRPDEKKKLFVDDSLLMTFFERLAEAEEPDRVSFRFVLALVLMRKKLLVYEGMDGQDAWIMRTRGSDQRHTVIDPHMDEDKIAEVSGHLGQILEGEL